MVAKLKWTADQLATMLEEAAERGMTQEALGQRYGLGRPGMADLLWRARAEEEQRKRLGLPVTMRAIAECFDVSLSFLERAAGQRPTSRSANSLDRPPRKP